MRASSVGPFITKSGFIKPVKNNLYAINVVMKIDIKRTRNDAKTYILHKIIYLQWR